jgi:hypothetical protein
VPDSGSWTEFLAIAREAQQIQTEMEAVPPVACPNDGEPLIAGPDGTLFCRFDGWTNT